MSPAGGVSLPRMTRQSESAVPSSDVAMRSAEEPLLDKMVDDPRLLWLCILGLMVMGEMTDDGSHVFVESPRGNGFPEP